MEQTTLFFETVEQIYRRVFRDLKPRTPAPHFVVEYRPFANVNSFIRHDGQNGAVRVRMSDLLEGAPAPVHEALAFILLSKLYRKQIPEVQPALPAVPEPAALGTFTSPMPSTDGFVRSAPKGSSPRWPVTGLLPL